ncbi:MAG TPA: type II secretion system F family protein [Mycobacteriales bacterium]|jgi:tight adherence protein B
MTAIVLAALAVAAGLVHSPSLAAARLRSLRWPAPDLAFHPPTVPSVRVAMAVGAIGGGTALGGWAWLGYGATAPILPTIAGAFAGATATAAMGRTAADRSRRRAEAALAEAVGSLAADLRAGQQPAEARAALGEPAAQHRAVDAVWAVSERSGAPAAAVLDRVEQDLRARQDQHREVVSALSGARSTGTLLAVLPLLGVGLGVGMGAHPITILLAQPQGQVALVGGVVLEALGVFWTSRIIASAEEAR